MKLTKVEIRNYRSIFMRDGAPVAFEFGDGMNALIGPNNCGKSNVLRAIALALEPAASFDGAVDLPPLGPKTTTRIICEFEIGTTPAERTLRRRLEAYEKSIKTKSTYAERGIARWAVSCRTGRRQAQFLSPGAGARQGVPELLEKAVAQFAKVLRFIWVRSGESLEQLLAGRFREVLHTVMQEHLRAHVETAERKRLGYIEDLRSELLSPLNNQIFQLVSALAPEVSAASIEPEVSTIAEALSKVNISLHDAVDTPLAEKGTGLRGAVLLATLRYLAEQSKRSVIFAVEEPEAFLHPGAQEALRDDLEGLAERPDVTLLVTTHSPFVVSRHPSARVIALAKNSDGATRVSGQTSGDEPRASLLGGLFRDAALPDLIERAAHLPESAQAYLVVEGWSDEQYLQIAADVLGRRDLLDKIAIYPAGGSVKAVMQALIVKSQSAKPVLVVLDNDEHGKSASAMLKKFNFNPKRELLSYGEVFEQNPPGIEAEDLFPEKLLARFVKESGEGVLQGKYRRHDGEWHFDLTVEAKGIVPQWTRDNAAASDFERWGALLDEIGKRTKLMQV